MQKWGFLLCLLSLLLLTLAGQSNAADKSGGTLADSTETSDTAPETPDQTATETLDPDRVEVESIEEATETITAPTATVKALPNPPEGGFDVYVVPISGPIGKPQLYILRRALKEAIENDVETIILDMDTPGGRLDVTLEMMEALGNFKGETITYVNDEAISAGSYISIACNDIYFSPGGIMGAAAVISGGGEEIGETMKQKIDSYLKAKVRVVSGDNRYRADVQRAMMDSSYELEIDGNILKEKDELLSLTADEAAQTYGNPPEPLLSSGTYESVDDLLNARYGAGNYNIREFHLSWSEEFAKWFETIAPVLFGIGVLMIIIEIKTPSFGVIGGLGIALVVIVFVSNYFAGLAGNEPILLFLLGVVLIVIEIFIMPGIVVALALGALCILSALIWSMADIWPTPDGGITVSPDALWSAAKDALLAFCIAGIGLVLAWRYLPESPLFRPLISTGSVKGVSVTNAGNSSGEQGGQPEIGATGRVTKELRPIGQVEIDGQLYTARCNHGQINCGQRIRVTQHKDFTLIVEHIS